MLNLGRFCGLVALLCTAAAAAAGCGDDDATPSGQGGAASSSSTTTSSATTSTSSSGGGGAGGEEPPCEPTEGVTLALTKLYWGEGNSGQWKKVGKNVDDLVSDASSTDLCIPAAGGAPDTPYPDGDEGIDNSFGKNLLPIIISLVPQWPAEVNNYLDTGFFNAMLKMYCLPPEGDVTMMTSKVFGGTNLGAMPKYDGTDAWPVAPEILGDPLDPESSTLVFANSSVTGQLFDSAEGQTFILAIPLDLNGKLGTLKLTLYSAQMTMTLSEDRKSATGGVIGGVLNTEEFIDQVKKIAWMGDLCDNPLYAGIETDVRRASDILSDGTQDPTKECDGISIGVQFEMKEVQLGPVGPPADMGNACP
jgi:hypothetical protein